ncbi:MAG TPA: hypothetical protein VMM80_06605 [Bacteroidota bacterium]|nr:hypothetical protein [Bacteroidota bacterium]
MLIGLMIPTLIPGIPAQAQEVRGEVKKVEIAGNEVTLTFDLKGAADEDYVIAVFLVPSKHPLAARELAAVRGDVGKGRFAGTGRKIIWTMSEISDLEEGETYGFRITVDKPGIPWYYWAGGGAAVAGGAALIFIKGSTSSPPPTQKSNPLPPDRPGP